MICTQGSFYNRLHKNPDQISRTRRSGLYGHTMTYMVIVTNETVGTRYRCKTHASHSIVFNVFLHFVTLLP